jgi:hypothetical protein
VTARSYRLGAATRTGPLIFNDLRSFSSSLRLLPEIQFERAFVPRRNVGQNRAVILEVGGAALQLVSCPINSPAKTGEFFEDRIGSCGPYEGFAVFVVFVDEGCNFVGEIFHTAK